MKQMRNILEKVTKEFLVEPLLELMMEHIEDFAEDRKRYQDALGSLKDELPTRELEEAIYQQIVSMVLFSGWLGLKANMNHFADPVARTFLEVDCETYLQEYVSKRLPEYIGAKEAIHHSLSQLPAEQEEVYDASVAYINHLETVVPKLAHYYGFSLGNELLPSIIPGYYADTKMTVEYRNDILETVSLLNKSQMQ